jgi:DNA-binding IclR family transcriptional regulator
VIRALDVLIELGRGDGPVQLMPLARALGLHPTTTFRMLESLRARGMVRPSGNGSYDLGPGTLELGRQFLRRISIARDAQELVEDLAKRVKETVSVGALDDGEVLYIAIAHGQHEFGIQSSPYARHPAHCTALGKALLAHLPEAKVAAIVAAHPLTALTSRTLTDPAALQMELETIRALGYAVDDEERTPGVMCIAAPIQDHTGAVAAAVSIAGPAARLREAGVMDLAGIVQAAAGSMSERLGAPAAFFGGPPGRPR